jgi:hypothetical protein
MYHRTSKQQKGDHIMKPKSLELKPILAEITFPEGDQLQLGHTDWNRGDKPELAFKYKYIMKNGEESPWSPVWPARLFAHQEVLLQQLKQKLSGKVG